MPGDKATKAALEFREQERRANQIRGSHPGLADDLLASLLDDFAAEEREACAKVAVRKTVQWSRAEDEESNDYRRGVEDGAAKIAAAIRARQGEGA